MSKKQMEALDAASAPSTLTGKSASEIIEAAPAPAVEPSDRWTRQTSVELALQHHKINGGMLTVDQLLGNATKFHDYITGETK